MAAKQLHSPPITSLVCVELVGPELDIRRRGRRPFASVAVPEATVDKNDFAQAWQNNVRRSRQVSPMQPEPEAERVNKTSDNYLRLSVLLWN